MSLKSLLASPLKAGSKYDFGHLGVVLLAALSAFDLQYGPQLAQALVGAGQSALGADVTKAVAVAGLTLAFVAGIKRQFHPDSQAAIDNALLSPGVTAAAPKA